MDGRPSHAKLMDENESPDHPDPNQPGHINGSEFAPSSNFNSAIEPHNMLSRNSMELGGS